jgi:hypothetical protein
MAHTEALGLKTIYLALDPADVQCREDGSGFYDTLNDTTPLRAVLPPEIMARLPEVSACVTLTGDAFLQISIGDDCQVEGCEEVLVSEISVFAHSPDERSSAFELPY